LEKDTSRNNFIPYDMILDGDEIVICGMSDVQGDQQAFITKTTADGNLLWTKHYGFFLSGDRAFCVRKNNSGSYIITGNSQKINSTDDNILYVQTDANGDEQGFRVFGPGQESNGRYLVIDASNIATIIGSTIRPGNGSSEYCDIIFSRIDDK